jgi:flagellar M-ring protein FliF
MDFLNKAFAQFNDLFRSMTPGGRITTGLLLVVAVVSVGYLFQHQVGGGDDYLFGGAPIQAATWQKMEAAFGKAGLNGYTYDGMVKVPHSQRVAYLAALFDAKALPPNFTESFKDDSGIFDSPMQRQVRIDQAKESLLSLVISHMKGISQASVIIDKQAQSGLNPNPLKTASVTVWMTDGTPPDDDLVDKIRYCVVAANAGMNPKNVTICDGDGTVYPGAEDDRDSDGGTYDRLVRKHEKTLNDKVRALYSYIPGLKVNSTFTLNSEKNTRSVEVKVLPNPVAVRTIENSHTMNRESVSSSGVPGLVPNGGGANAAAALGPNGGKGPNESNDESRTEQVNDPSKTSTETEKVGLTPKRATVSVGIPASYYEVVWRVENPSKEGEKPDKDAIGKIQEKIEQGVRTDVANLLPPMPDVKDPMSLVTVTTFQDPKPAALPAPPVTQRALSWLGQNWPMMAMIGLVLFSLAMLRSMLRSVPALPQEPAAISMRVPGPEQRPQTSEEPVEVTAARRLRRISGSGPSLRDELSEFVKEDPDSAANILRSWIGQVT